MIFTARGLLVSLAFLAVVYCPLSLLAVFVWRGIKCIAREFVSTSPNLLFGLRIFPFAVSVVLTLFFAFPSFWLMERPTLDEDGATFALAACALVMLGAGLFRVLRVQSRTTRAVERWLAKAELESDAQTPMLSAARGAPPLILVGLRKPKVMISDAAAAMLSDAEMRVAVQHEIGHARAWDNLKKTLISSTPFPGMSSLETAWLDAAELAADDTAVKNRQEALDLAAALLKLSRFICQTGESVLATGLLSGSSSVSVRVDRLLRWRMAGRPFRRTWSRTLPLFLLILIAGTSIAGLAAHYSAALALTHHLTELLVP
jgi:hypothetical protein